VVRTEKNSLISMRKGTIMVTTRGKTALAGICLFVGLCLTSAHAQSDATTKVAAITQAYHLQLLFAAETNPYIREEYLKQLPAVLNRFGAKDSEQWVDDFLDKALGDSKAEVVVTAIRYIGSMQKATFIDRLVNMYSTAERSKVGLSSEPIRFEILRALKPFSSDPRVAGLLNQVIADEAINPYSQEVRLAIFTMKESGNKDFVPSLNTFSSAMQKKKESLEAKIRQGKLSKEEEPIYKNRISLYASLVGEAQQAAHDLFSSQGGAR
jgi:hypothetical protein